MTAVERLAGTWMNAYADTHVRIQALIDRWRREADDLEARAVRHYDVACLSDGDRCTERAKELRVRAAEVERAIGGGREHATDDLPGSR